MVKREAELKAAFGAELARMLPEFIVQYMASAGSPDRSISGAGLTTHWEMKHATPTFISPGLQELTCMRLAVVAHCRYVIWYENVNGDEQRTMIVHPREIHNRTSWYLHSEVSTPGFDHRWLVEQIRKAHACS